MTDLGPILDYASPRKRSAFRLPATSDLAVEVGDGHVAIQESLAGQTGAIGALVFGAFVLAVVALAAAASVYDFHRHRYYPDWSTAYVLLVAGAAEAATMFGVLQQTWRCTRLRVEYDDLRLSFLSPFRRRHYRWTGNDIADVVVAQTANAETGLVLGEVLITRVVGGEVRLFTDHPAARLGPIAVAVHGMLRDGRAVDEVPPQTTVHQVQAAVPVLPDVAPRAEVTTGRLVDVHRGMRERRGRTTKESP